MPNLTFANFVMSGPGGSRERASRLIGGVKIDTGLFGYYIILGRRFISTRLDSTRSYRFIVRWNGTVVYSPSPTTSMRTKSMMTYILSLRADHYIIQFSRLNTAI